MFFLVNSTREVIKVGYLTDWARSISSHSSSSEMRESVSKRAPATNRDGLLPTGAGLNSREKTKIEEGVDTLGDGDSLAARGVPLRFTPMANSARLRERL